MATFEEEYEDVLQNIEFAIISVYRENPALLDYEVEKALNALILAYQSEQRGRAPSPVAFTPLGQQVYAAARAMCEWRLGRAALESALLEPMPALPAPLSMDELLACLKRVRKSVQVWNKREGQQGYLRFVAGFVG